MKVIICGAGRVGQGIARRLAREHHEVTMIDQDARLIDIVQTELDVKGLQGHAGHPDVLKAAGGDTCDMIVAVTYSDEINMVICQVADTLFSIPTKIARVRAQQYLEPGWRALFSREGLGIDLVISPEVEVGDAILQRFKTPGAMMSVNFGRGDVQLIGIEVLPDSPVLDTALDQLQGLFPSLNARIVGISRGGTVFAPRGNDHLKVGDTAYVAVLKSHAHRLNSIFNRPETDVRRVVVVGGGNVGLYVAAGLEKQADVRVRVIEADIRQAEKAVSDLNRTIVIHGDGLTRSILEEADAPTADLVIATTHDDKTNILISKLAKQMGAKRSLALVNAPELSQLAIEMGVDAVLDPKALTVSRILMKMRRGRILALQSLEDGAAEIAEGVTLETSPLIGKPLGYDDLPKGITAAAILRDGEVIFAAPDVAPKANDHVLLFYEDSLTSKVEQFFRVSADFF
ncbi:Trk system potassium transporter TrkA [Henriciella aquimarina]|uniref:Trk system potassium transporter TrkA n=1 Tax=Henriciella aquimarina TaxID=545261 RepID=UPI0009FBD0D4|nr:Trk system potassium transporter TrkA [Henriciella aquimarina]